MQIRLVGLIVVMIAETVSTTASAAQTIKRVGDIGHVRIELPDKAGGSSYGLIDEVTRICSLSNSPCPRLVIVDHDPRSLQRIAGGVSVSADLIRELRSSYEETGFAALVIALFSADRTNASERPSDLGRQLLAIGVAGLGQRIDPHAPADEAGRMNNFKYRGNTEPATQTSLASKTLMLSIAAGSCSGPLVAFLERVSRVSANPTPENRRFATFVGDMIRDFGPEIYPPDFSCERSHHG